MPACCRRLRQAGRGQIGALAGHLRLEGRAFHAEQHVAHRDFLALGKHAFLQEAGDAGAQLHAVDRLHPAHELHAFRHRVLFGGHHPDRGRALRAELREGRGGQPKGQRHRGDAGKWTERHCGVIQGQLRGGFTALPQRVKRNADPLPRP